MRGSHERSAPAHSRAAARRGSAAHPWLLAFALVLAACAAEHKAPPGGSAERPAVYLVRKGDTLYSIAWRYNLDYHDLAQWNRIQNPDRILAGQRLRLTLPSASAARAPARPAPVPAPDAMAEAQPAEQSASARDALTWTWPTRGRLARPFSVTEVGKKGMDIAGVKGQPVYAAAPGKVVYSGDGLLGYGPLVIIKHNETFLSAYAYNEKLLVREGEQVALGQRIAEMGSNGSDQGLLHFEIRRQGKPVDPMLYLPARP